nr:MAG TPA: hypothetical protein [Inoviridae sp.]
MSHLSDTREDPDCLARRNREQAGDHAREVLVKSII